jgi:hypothetical protein
LASAAPAIAATGGPPAPVDLFNSDVPCSTDVNAPAYVNGFEGVDLIGRSLDTNPADSPDLTEQFQVWPVSAPAQVTTLSDSAVLPQFEGGVSVPAADLSDGQTYAWQVQATGASGTSGLSATCYFTVDNTAPSTPTITSPNYPSGVLDQGGAPVQFVLGANGSSDVIGYVFSWEQDLPGPVIATIGPFAVPQPQDPFSITSAFVRASSLGGSATLSLLPPNGNFAPETLYVASLDRAFNESPVATYTFFLKDSFPTLTPLVPAPKFGQQMEFLLRPDPSLEAISPTVSYTVQVLDSTQRTFTLKASADGTAEVAFKLDGPAGDSITVTSNSANGWVSGINFWSIFFDTTPTVSSAVYPEGQTSGGVGIPGTFTFAPKVTGIVSYTYSINDGPSVTVPANARGMAEITFTPDQSGAFYDLNVFGTTRDGVQLAPYDYIFFTN